MKRLTKQWIARAAIAAAAVSAAPAQSGDGASLLDMTDLEAERQALALLGDNEQVNVLAENPQLLKRDAVPIVPSERGDPMVIPFIKEEYVRGQAQDKMNEAFDRGQMRNALALARYLVRTYPGTKEANEAQTMINVINARYTVDDELPDEPEQPEGPELPQWVATNLKAIIFDASDPQVMVGFNFYRQGEPVEEYPNVVVEEILDNSVVFKVSNDQASKTYSVSLPGD